MVVNSPMIKDIPMQDVRPDSLREAYWTSMKSQAEMAEMLEEAHTSEMKQYDMPESQGLGFWNFKEQYKTEKRAAQKQTIQDEQDAFWESVGAMPAQEELNYQY
jgi:hypothetical protein